MNYRQHAFNIFLTVLIAFMGGYLFASATSAERIVYVEKDSDGKERVVDGPLDFNLLWKVWNTIDSEYVEADAFDKDTARYGAIKGLVESVGDSYTVFMDPSETKQFQQNLDGQLEGIGAEITIDDNVLTIISPLKDSPAEKSGILPGDVVYRINGEPTSELTLFEAIMKIRGEKGTNVTLTIIREGNDPFDIDITRGNIEIDSVSYELLENNIAYVSINQFSDSTQNELSVIISQLLLDEASGMILDLRYNGGGYLNISVDIVSEFLKGQVKAVTLKRRLKGDDQIYLTNGKARVPDLPLVVLINQGSASASEIVAGAIQDYKRGYLIGEQSFGKGSVQEVIKLDEGSSLRLTVAKWVTPKDRDINHLGITPDKIVGLSEEDIAADRDPQLDAAIEYVNNLISF